MTFKPPGGARPGNIASRPSRRVLRERLRRRASTSPHGATTMSSADETAIRDIEHRFNAAWNAHDPEGLSESLVDDAQFITVNGAWTTSRAGFRDLMQRLHGASGPFRSSARRTPEMQVRFLAPDIALLHSRFWIAGE